MSLSGSRPESVAGLVCLLLLAVAPVKGQSVSPPARPHVGAYRYPTGELLLVGWESADGKGIRIRDFADGTRATLERSGTEEYRADSVNVTFEVEKGAVITALVHSARGSRRARRIPLRLVEVSWANDSAMLAGTLVLPSGPGPFPVVIAQPGSSWQTRYNEHGMFTALTFAASGIAGFAYDKRGFGESTGEQLVSFRQTARDLAAAANTLSGRFDINPQAIFYWGLSQGGWIVPLAATMTSPAGVILVGAAGTTPARQEILRAQAVLRARGFPAEQVQAIRRFQELAFHYGSTGEGWEDYLAARRAAEGQQWLRWVWSPTEPGPQWWMWGRLNGDYNPLPALLALRVPLLSQWGEFDLNVDPEVNRAIFEVALDAAGNRDHTLIIVPKADHELEQAADARDALRDAAFAPGVWDRMIEWLEARVGRSVEVSPQ